MVLASGSPEWAAASGCRLRRSSSRRAAHCSKSPGACSRNAPRTRRAIGRALREQGACRVGAWPRRAPTVPSTRNRAAQRRRESWVRVDAEECCVHTDGRFFFPTPYRQAWDDTLHSVARHEAARCRAERSLCDRGDAGLRPHDDSGRRVPAWASRGLPEGGRSRCRAERPRAANTLRPRWKRSGKRRTIWTWRPKN